MVISRHKPGDGGTAKYSIEIILTAEKRVASSVQVLLVWTASMFHRTARGARGLSNTDGRTDCPVCFTVLARKNGYGCCMDPNGRWRRVVQV